MKMISNFKYKWPPRDAALDFHQQYISEKILNASMYDHHQESVK